MAALRGALLLVLVVCASAANPIRRVVNMLQDMQKKIEQEGERDKKLFDKFMCYCSQGGVDLEKSIHNAESKIPVTKSDLQESLSQKDQLKVGLKRDTTNEHEAKDALAEAGAIHTKEEAEIKREYEETKSNLNTLSQALDSLEAGNSFLQTKQTDLVRNLAINMDLTNVDRELLTSFLEQREDSFTPGTSQVIGIMKGMKDEMVADLKEMQKSEHVEEEDFEQLSSAKEKEIDTSDHSVEDKTVRKGKVGVKIEELREDLEDTEASYAEDTKFKKALETECKTKQADWDLVQKTRAEELLAISETIKILNDDDALELFKKTLPSPSLLQMKVRGNEVRRQALQILRSRNKHDSRLDLIALAIHGKKVSFDKVLTMIDGMVKLLNEEQVSDNQKNSYCKKELDENEDKKKGLETEVSDLTKFIDETSEAIDTYTEELEALATGIKDLDRSVSEATENRKEENKEYKDVRAQNTAAKELLKVAKARLNKFYNPGQPSFEQMPESAPPMLVQVTSHMRRALGDGAPPPPPETFGAYTKKGGESSGVLSMVDALIADLDKEMAEMEVEEKDAQKDYEEYIADSAQKRAADSKSIEEKESAKAAGEEALGKSKLEQKSKKKEAYSTAMLLRDLHLECDWLVTNYETRKTARSGEIDALQKAKAVLSGADFALLQTATATKRRVFLGPA